jgi:glycosyltransferase involved in cell wall biosynthesis
MRIAFYAPLKAPDHPVPSGDRQMARLLIEALATAGHQVELVSSLRAFHTTPEPAFYDTLSATASVEASRIMTSWERGGLPDLWFTYHPYYKAPDLLGPELAAATGIPYVTAEASYSERRNDGAWADTQRKIVSAVRNAAVNLCFTERDRNGLERAVPDARLVGFPPFIKSQPVTRVPGRIPNLIAVAMMRLGDKLQSYRMLAAALMRISDRDWTLTIVGSGPAEADVRSAFGGIATERINWVGQVAPEDVPSIMAKADIYVWPGFGEAYGLAYLEAGASSLPVVAQRIAGVSEAVVDGETALLTAPEDVDAFAASVSRLLNNADLRDSMGERGREFVTGERSLEAAAQRLNAILLEIME